MNSFVHTIWGIYSNKNKLWGRLSKVDADVKLYLLNPYSPKTVVYCFGTDNEHRMQDLGFETRLIDPKPYVWDMETEQYRHKMEAWKQAADEFDAVTFLDWDTINLKPVPQDYWDTMAKGNRIQCPIYQYHLKRVARKGDERKVSTASYLYLRGKDIMPEMIKTWEQMGKPLKEEYALTKYIDDQDGGWKGIQGYRKHDPIYYTMTPLYPDKDRSKQVFGHYNHNVISRLIGNGTKVQERIDNFRKQVGI